MNRRLKSTRGQITTSESLNKGHHCHYCPPYLYLEAINFPILASVLGNTYGPTNGLNGRSYPEYITVDSFALPQLNTYLLP